MTKAKAEAIEKKVEQIKTIAERAGIESIANWAEQAMTGIANGKANGYYFEFCEKIEESIIRLGL